MTWPLTVLPRGGIQVADYPASAAFGPRLLTDYEFVWMLRGSAQWTLHDRDPAGDQTYTLRPGTLALSLANTVDSYQWDVDRISTHAYVHFGIPSPLPRSQEVTWPVTRSFAASPVLGGICDYLLQLAGMPGDEAIARTNQLVGLLLDVFVRGPLGDPEPTLHPCVAAAIECTHRAWVRDGPRILDAHELAAAANVSVGHLFRVFRSEYSCGPARALELTRLARCAVGLQRSNASLSEIAHQGGFADAYHFSRRFTRAYGMPPGAYRAGGLGPDPLEPVRQAGLLPIAAALMSSAPDA